jgi:hypothetical protein
MRIEEIVFSRNEKIGARNIYVSAIEIMERAAKEHDIEEIKNVYETDGPQQHADVRFSIIKKFDDFTKLVMQVSIYGESSVMKNSPKGFLVIDFRGSVVTEIETDDGNAGTAFTEFYMNSIYPIFKKLSAKRLNITYEEMEDVISQVNKTTI